MKEYYGYKRTNAFSYVQKECENVQNNVGILDLSTFAVGDSWTATAGVYDAGTEVNSEAAGTMPGPADGGEGFNATRTDTGYVAMHPGVVSGDDGLTNSVLTVQHKFDNPAVRIMVTRIE